MSELTHTFTQTHRHYISRINSFPVEMARTHHYPMVAECGQVWIPHDDYLTRDLPMCKHCEGTAERPLRIPGRTHFVYRCYDADERLVYVGCSIAPRTRMEQHKTNSWWFEQVVAVRYVVFPNKGYALFKEREAIETENPRWNIRHRDRTNWTLVDYRDHHCALTFNGASEKRLERVRRDAEELFGVDITDPEAAAS